MLKQFSSNARKLNRVISKINPQNLVNLDLSGSLLDIEIPTNKSFQSRARNTVFNPITNIHSLNTQSFLTSSLLNIDLPSSQSFQSQTRSNPNPTKLVNNANTINDFHSEIFEYSARNIERAVDAIDSVNNTLTIYNVNLAYGTEEPTSYNFEVFLFGLKIPSDYTVKQIENDVVVTLLDNYIDFENTLASDIYVIGKLVDIELDTENDIDILTENDENIII
jgi:hypothetical protein